jgi:tRNA (cmo5U34)-methyltransferase
MLDVCRDKLARAGLADRVALHCGTTETLDPGARFDAATAILVSQFIHDTAARTAFFAEIARRLVPGGLLVSADLSAAAADDGQRDSWLALMGATDLAAARARFGAGVAALPPDRTAALIQAAGFTPPVPFFQALLLRAWHATRRQAPEKESP